VLLSDFSTLASVSGVLLPAGELALQVTARNALGGVSVQSVNASVTVAKKQFADAAGQASFLANITALVSNLGGTGAVALATAAADMLNDPDSPIASNLSAAAGARATLLESVAATQSSPVTSEALESLATSVAALLGNATQINGASATTALSLLATVCGAGTTTTGALAVNVETASAAVTALSSIAAAALASDTTGVDIVVLSQLSSLTNSLAGSLFAGLDTPGGAPVTLDSDAIQMYVALDAPGPGSRLFAQNLTAPGSASSFSSMPTDLFANTSAAAGVRTLFASLGFNPFMLDPNSTGVTQLTFFSSAASISGSGEDDEVRIAGLSTPIFFTLPGLAGLADGSKAQCQFWDTAAANSSTAGCAGLPDPRPPMHDVFFVPGFTAATDADMALAWNISGDLVDDASCRVTLLDCSLPNPGVVYPDPSSPLTVPAVACPPRVNGSTAPPPVLRVYGGRRCALWQAGNARNCSWDNVKQAFIGSGCVPSGATVQCACRHLTSFEGASKPSIPTCSLSDMTALQPGDLLTKMRTLFTVVCALFGGMCVGAFVGFGLDRQQRQRVYWRLQMPDTGFHVAGDDVCLWRFSLDPLDAELAAPSGPAVVLSSIIGIPFARLRAAMPDELVSSSMADALGRRHAFSLRGMTASLPDFRARLKALSKRWQRRHLTSIAANTGEHADGGVSVLGGDNIVIPDGGGDDSRTHAGKLEDLVGTALILAYLQVTQLMPVVELAQRRSAAVRYFRGVRTPAGRDFGYMQTTFVTLLSPGILNIKTKWLIRARIWRLILAQSSDGSWGATRSIAFALEARPLQEIEELPRTLLVRISDFFRGAAQAFSETDTIDGHVLSAALENVHASSAGTKLKEEDMLEFVAQGGQDEDERTAKDSVFDCPLTNSERSIRASIPRALRAVAAEDVTADVECVWSTMCCLALLERQRVCWLCGDGDLYPAQERTIVDGKTLATSQPAFSHHPAQTQNVNLRVSEPDACFPRPFATQQPAGSGSRRTRRSIRRWLQRWRTPRCGSAANT
jgi:hypothetical protein